jgi:small-conductance mechanosensitive channel
MTAATDPAFRAPPDDIVRAQHHAVTVAADIKHAVAGENGTVGTAIDTLDSYGFDVGKTHVSLWSASLVLMVVLGVILFARFGSRFAHWVLAKVSRFDSTQRLLAEKLVSIAVWAFAILVGIDLLGIDLTALTVFSGAFGLAIGFGLQKTFGNLIAGIILLMDRSIKPGDVIAIADQAGRETFGQIRKIGIRAVSVTTRDRREYLIPNENLMINQVENWSYSDRNVRIQVPVGVSYQTDLKQAEALMLQAAGATTRILKVPAPGVWLDSYGDSSVKFVIQCWIRDPENGVGNVRSEVLKRLWWLFKEHGVEIPFQQRDINLRDTPALRELIEALREEKG